MKRSYLQERIYSGNEENKLNVHKLQYWERVLGKSILSELLEENESVKFYFEDREYQCDKNLIGSMLDKELNKYFCEAWILSLKEIFFGTFYQPIIENAAGLVASELKDYKDYFDKQIYSDFSKQLAHRLQALCMRTLIKKMYECKDRKMLKGEDTKEEYEYFCSHMLRDEEYVKSIFEEFPILDRCVYEQAKNMADYYAEIVKHFVKDRIKIQEEWGSFSEYRQITRIRGGFADVHNQGRQVMEVCFENNRKLLYKPRSMENEKGFMDLLQWISKRTGTRQYQYAFLSFHDHSWTEIVEHASCGSKEELQRFYVRFGEQLFLTYLLGTKDLHSENLISAGEYPVLIDLETLVNIKNQKSPSTAEEEIHYQLFYSVLSTGLLPFYSWNKGGKGVDNSALGGKGGQKYPFRIPVIVNQGTSDMAVKYQYPVSKEQKNTVIFQDTYQSPVFYEKEITRGFQAAYRQAMENRAALKEKLKDCLRGKSRFLVADTQRYSMALVSSYHLDLLDDGAKRELFLYTMWLGRETEERAIVEAEVRSLLKGDIPYFYYDPDSTSLHSADGGEIKDYFQFTAKSAVYEKLEGLNRTDMNQQCDYIAGSLQLLPEGKEACQNRVYRVENTEESEKVNTSDLRRRKVVEDLTRRLLSYAVWDKKKTDVNWPVWRFVSTKSMAWSVRTMNMYLYEGLSGMLLLFSSLCKYYEKKEITDIFLALKARLFRYTDTGLKSPKTLQSSNTGLYEGEASILYTYLHMYEACGDETYLSYARKHAQIVSGLLKKDTRCDLLSGNAGAAFAFIRLYEITEDELYISMAAQAVRTLEKAATEMPVGIGWHISGEETAMAGMAHGNSGILMPVFWLWTKTRNPEYKILAEKIWAYENSLYDKDQNNWRDIREEGADAVAWCHGAPGVLYSRLYCCACGADCGEWEQRLKTDFFRAYRKTKNYWKRDSLSLCHGICGNLLILKRADEISGTHCEDYGSIIERYLESRIWEDASELLLPQEKLNPGLMSGYGGILLYFLQQEKQTPQHSRSSQSDGDN